RYRRGPLLLRRHGGPFGGAISIVHRAGDSWFPEYGLLDAVRSGFGGGIASRLRRNAGSLGRARSRSPDVFERFSAVGLSAHHFPAGRSSSHQSGHAERNQPAEPAQNAG